MTATFQQLYLLKATLQYHKTKSGYYSMPYDPENHEEDDQEFDKAVELRDQGNSEEALRIFRRLIRLNKNELDVCLYQYWAGVCFCDLNKYEEAAKHLRPACESPNLDKFDNGLMYIAIREQLAWALWHLNEEKEALKVLEEAEDNIRFYEDPEALISFSNIRGRVFFQLSMFREALREFKKALKLCTQVENESELTALFHYLIGKTYFYADEQLIANQYLSKVDLSTLVQVFHYDFHLYKMQNLERLRKFDAVLNEFENLKSIGLHEYDLSHIYNTVGIAQYYIGNDELAIEAFKESGKHDPDPDWIPESNSKYLQAIRKGALNPLIWLKTKKKLDLDFPRIADVMDSLFFIVFLVMIIDVFRILLTDDPQFCSALWNKVFTFSFLFSVGAWYLARQVWYPLAYWRFVNSTQDKVQDLPSPLTLKYAVAHKMLGAIAIVIAGVLEVIHLYACNRL